MQLSERELFLQKCKTRLKPQKSLEYHKSEIGRKLKFAREKTTLTQFEVASLLGWPDDRKVRRIENGETVCKLEDLCSLCQLYEVLIADILPDDLASCASAIDNIPLDVLKMMARNLGNAISRVEQPA